MRARRGQRGARRVLVDGDDDAGRGVERVARSRPRGGAVRVGGRLVGLWEDGGRDGGEEAALDGCAGLLGAVPVLVVHTVAVSGSEGAGQRGQCRRENVRACRRCRGCRSSWRV